MQTIPIWQTRSFWLALFTAVQITALAFGFSFEDSERFAWADRLADIMPLVTLALAYRERMNPQRRVVLW